MNLPSASDLPDPPAPPLVGRARETATLRAALDAAIGRHGAVVLIGGEAGIGKTTIAEAICAEAGGRGANVLIGRCYDLSETAPYGPWREAFARLDGVAMPAVLIGGEETTVASQAALHQQAREALAALAAMRPLVVLLDDLHWADPASLELLRTLARGLAEVPMLLLVTYRGDEVTRHHPLYALLPILVREARATRLDLRPLDEGDLRALVRPYALAPADEDRLLRYLQGHAEGNPFYAGELLRALEEERILRPRAGHSHLGNLADARVPTLLRQVLDSRLDRLGDDVRDLLAIGAVIGQEVALDLWVAVAETNERALSGPIERAVEARILVEAPGGMAVRFAHALIREVLYQGIGALRRRALHRRTAEALLATPQIDPEAVAFHFRQASDPRAAEWLIRAGDRALRAQALVTAGARFEAALALMEATGASAGERGWVGYRLGRAYWLADPRRGLSDLAQAALLAEEAGDKVLQAVVAFNQGFLLCMVGQMRRGLATIEAATPRLNALTEPERTRLVASHGNRADARSLLVEWFAWTGRFADALALGAQIVPTVHPDGPAPGIPFPTLAETYVGLAVAHTGLGRPAEARRAFAAARICNQSLDSVHQIGTNARQELGWVVLQYQTDRLDERRTLADEAEQAWRRARGARPDIVPASASLPLMLLEGRWTEAQAVAEEHYASRSSGWVRIAANSTLAYIAREMGDLERAWGCATEDFSEGPATEPGDSWLLDALPIPRLAALIATDRGDFPAARAWLECHDRWLAWSGAVLGLAEGQLAWATYHRATGNLTAARDHADRALTHASNPRQPLALLAAHRFLGELATASDDIAAAAHLDATLALADTCAAPYERALCLLARAEFQGRAESAAGEREAARVALDEARATFANLGAAPALNRAEALAARLAAPSPQPTLAAPATLPFGLTTREAEVLRLIAQGLSDPQVAEQLFVSRHTVNSHLKAIYGKLGVTNRAAATRLALDHHLA